VPDDDQSKRGSAAPGSQASQPGHEPTQSPQPSSTAAAAAPGDKATTAPPKGLGTVTLTIDGRSVTVPKGTLVVEAAKLVNVEVPVFCYHHKLDPVGACRLCLVEISPGPPKPTTACTTPAAEGMVVRTNTALAVGARADILEYELVNHPLDCPICDKGGECPLQDYTFRHGYPTSRIDAPRLHFRKPIPLSENIALDRERCVLCYRCTRYYDEITWSQELTADQRGVHSFITSQFDEPLQSVFSGNIIDLCPVGALTSRVWRFESRPWDMDPTPSICSRCSVGCNVTLWQRRHELVRVTSRENDEIDEGWICDRGRFEYTDVNSPDRLRTPRVAGVESTWDSALEALLDGIKGRKLGIFLPQDVTNEELFLLRRLVDGPWRGARVAIEGRTGLPPPSGETLAIKDLDGCKAIVVIASDTADDVPIVNLRIKKAVSKLGAKLIVVHPGELDLDRGQDTYHVRAAPGQTADAVRRLAGHELLQYGPVGILYGDGRGTEDVDELGKAVAELAQALGARVMPLYRATNERGALAVGLDGRQEDLEGCDAVVLWGPGRPPSSARFVAVWDSLPRPEHEGADVVLPSATFAETQGSYTNLEGRVQFVHPVLRAALPLRESWEVLSELGQRLGVEGMDYLGVFQIQREASRVVEAFAALAEPPAPQKPATAVLYGPARP
jgi:NADH dehydrogenase/NADH:ubiquinone oxidoreductase subunit G